ncbi:MAG: serine/threonine-protein kinase [Acidobacteriia bacterium]|nr:serine/threonine-protein kinase [Terriglobia bacterium]
MKPGDRPRVEEIFHQALQQESAQRDAYVRQACRGDSDLRREVSSLLANHEKSAGCEPWAARAASQLIDSPTPLQPGQSLGPYRIETFLAAGGMGEVYRATDTRLNRQVAIKVSAAKFSERFEREARVIASLSHPNICTIHDVGPNYLVMEFLEGAPLRGPYPLHQAAEYASQILDALDTAHRKGIVHRDLKPANILLTKQGVKLLDFGLARESGSLDQADATLTAGLTREGQIIGTLQYMSPEQLHGKQADARSDLFSFGCVLYEMLSGKWAFEGQSAASVIAAILEREPAPLNLAPPLERVVNTCLAKNPEDRFQNALDLRRALTWALEQPVTVKANGRVWIGIACALILASMGVWAATHFRQPVADDRVIRFQIVAPEGGSLLAGSGFAGGFNVSPDGRMAVFAGVVKGKSGLWIRPLEAATARLLPGTEGAGNPFWSPDSRSVAFSAGGVLQRFDLSRETASKICEINGVFWGGSWAVDGRILFSIREAGLFQVPDSGGTPSQVKDLDRSHGDLNFSNPQILSGGRFLYTVQGLQSAGVYAGSLKKPAERMRLLSAENTPSTSQTGASCVTFGDGKHYLIWIAGTTLFAQQFDPDELRLMGESSSLADPVFDVQAGGNVLLYATSPPLRQFKWFDRTGKEISSLGEPGPYNSNRISPDGRRVATTRSGRTPDLWILETGRGVASRLTSGRGIHILPVWSPDGRTILYSGGAPFNIFRVRTDGTGSEERVLESQDVLRVNDWSRDGRSVIYNQRAPETGTDLWTLAVTPDGKLAPGAKPRPFAREPFNQDRGRFSPDVRWVAYQSDESGRYEVYVRAFPESGQKFLVSTGGGAFPQWGPQSRAAGIELFYVSRDRKLMVSTLKLGAQSVEPSAPRELFPMPPGFGANSTAESYDTASDGQRFLINAPSDSPQPLNVIVNWPALLKVK